MYPSEAEGLGSTDVGEGVVEKYRVLGAYAEFLACAVEYFCVGLVAMLLEGGEHAVEVIVHVVAILAEFIAYHAVPHHFVGVGEEVEFMVAVKLFEFAQACDGNAYEEAFESAVYLLVGDIGVDMLAQFGAPLFGGDVAELEFEEDAVLAIFAEHSVGVGQTDGLQGLDGASPFYFHYDPSEVKHQIFHLGGN